MSYLTFADVENMWTRINNTVTPHSFISALWGYCKSREVVNWNRLFFDLEEVKKVINLFYDEGGEVQDVYEDHEVRSSLRYIKDVMIPFFIDSESQECGFIADLLLKYFDVLYPDQRKKNNREIIGARGLRARAALESTSKWCRKLAAEEFDEDIEVENEGEATTEEDEQVTPKVEVILKRKGEGHKPAQYQVRPYKTRKMNEEGRWVTLG